MILVGLNGPAQSGKDTAFSFIQEWANENGRVAVRRGFADLLKLSAYRLFKPDCTIEEAIQWCDWVKSDGGIEAWWDYSDPSDPDGHKIMDENDRPMVCSLEISGREFLQHYGTEAHRDVFDEDFWVKALLPDGLSEGGTAAWQKSFPGADIAVITDVRFDNEARQVARLGQIWTINRAGVSGINEHPSESGLDGEIRKVIVPNIGDLELFRKEVRDSCETYLAPKLKEEN